MRLINFIFLAIITNAISQNLSPEIHIVYDFEYLKFKDSKKKKIEQTILISRASGSFFSYKQSFDLAYTRIDQKVSDMGILMYNVKPNFLITTVYNQDVLTFYEYIGGKIYTYQEKNDLKWSLKDEFKSINNYKVQKVTTRYGSRTWTGWFCKDIPITKGPYKFNGLPGALLEISSDDGIFSFLMNDIYQLEKPSNLTSLDFMMESDKEIVPINQGDLNTFRKTYDISSASERAMLNEPGKYSDYELITIDESGERKPVEVRKRLRNYIEKLE